MDDDEIIKNFHKLLNEGLENSPKYSISDAMKTAAIRLWHTRDEEVKQAQ